MVIERLPPDLNTQDFVESRSRSFTKLWPVAQDYAITEGRVVPVSDTGELYLPMARPELPGEITPQGRLRPARCCEPNLRTPHV